MKQSPSERRLDHIDALRGLAALAVCWFHLTRGGTLFPEGIVKSISSRGFLGVEVFFVISGFVIPWAMWRANYKISDFGRFLGKRMLRLYPPYMIALLLILILNYLASFLPFFHGKFHFATEFKEFITEATYLNGILGRGWELMVVAWTLAIEIQFYLLAGILAACFRFDRGIITLLGLMMTASSALLVINSNYIFSYLPFFVLGWAAAWLHAISKRSLLPWILFLWSLVIMWLTQTYEATFVALMTFLVIVFWTLQIPRALIWLGAISYSLYLLHVPIGGKIMNIALRYEAHEWIMPTALVLALTTCLAVAWSYWRLIELPFHQLSRMWFPSGKNERC